jgi:hypothetical protein
MFTYAYGYKKRSEAYSAMVDMFADGEISMGDKPEIHGYKNKNGEQRWRITLNNEWD